MTSDLYLERLKNKDSLAILVDGSSVFDKVRRLNFDWVYRGIKAERELVKAVYYISCWPGKDMKGFADMLSYCGFEINYKVSVLKNSQDISIALDMFTISDSVDTIALVSNRRSVFTEAAIRVRNKGKVIESWSFLNLPDESNDITGTPFSYLYNLDKFVDTNLETNSETEE